MNDKTTATDKPLDEDTLPLDVSEFTGTDTEADLLKLPKAKLAEAIMHLSRARADADSKAHDDAERVAVNHMDEVDRLVSENGSLKRKLSEAKTNGDSWKRESDGWRDKTHIESGWRQCAEAMVPDMIERTAEASANGAVTGLVASVFGCIDTVVTREASTPKPSSKSPQQEGAEVLKTILTEALSKAGKRG